MTANRSESITWILAILIRVPRKLSFAALNRYLLAVTSNYIVNKCRTHTGVYTQMDEQMYKWLYVYGGGGDAANVTVTCMLMIYISPVVDKAI